MRYILYARKSSESEDRQVQSIDDQLRILKEMATSRGWEIIEEITESHSAKDPGARPGFEQMLKKIERGQADAILCWAINRLTRNPVDSGKLSWLLQTGVLLAIQTADKQFLPSDNVLLFAVETGTANQFILDLKKSVKRGTESKVAKGWAPYRAPEGYYNDLYEHTILPDPGRFEMLQRAWQLLIAGTHTVAQIVKILNEDWGYTTRKRHKSGGGKLSRTVAYDLFTNRFYAGYFPFKGELYKGSHQPMITMAEFDQAQLHIRGAVGKRRQKRHEFPYTGIITCTCCGGGVTGELQTGRHKRGRWVYYHCSNGRGTCGKRSVREDLLEQQIDACLQNLTIVSELGDIIRESLRDWVHEEFDNLTGVYEEQSKTLVETERRLAQLLDLRLSGIVDNATYLNKEKDLKGIVNHLRVEVEKTHGALDRTRDTVHNALAFCETAAVRFKNGSLFERREIARLLGTRYLLEDGQVSIEINDVFQLLGQALQPGERRSEGLIWECIEPLKSGSDSIKETSEKSKVSLGWAGRTKVEPHLDRKIYLYAWFGQIHQQNLYLPSLVKS